jgi:hypothetical protein
LIKILSYRFLLPNYFSQSVDNNYLLAEAGSRDILGERQLCLFSLSVHGGKIILAYAYAQLFVFHFLPSFRKSGFGLPPAKLHLARRRLRR